MTLRRPLARWLSAWLMVAMLFTQIATSAYACPAMNSAQPQHGSMAGMPCAAMVSAGMALDADQPGLCMQHCQFGSTQPPADSPQPFGVAAPALLPLFTLAPAAVTPGLPAAWTAHRRQLERVPRAPHSLVHCCWRI